MPDLQLARQLGEQLVQPLAVRVVEVARRLVGEQHGRVGRQRARHRRALLLAARELARAMMHAPAEPDALEQRRRAAPRLPRRPIPAIRSGIITFSSAVNSRSR